MRRPNVYHVYSYTWPTPKGRYKVGVGLCGNGLMTDDWCVTKQQAKRGSKPEGKTRMCGSCKKSLKSRRSE